MLVVRIRTTQHCTIDPLPRNIRDKSNLLYNSNVAERGTGICLLELLGSWINLKEQLPSEERIEAPMQAMYVRLNILHCEISTTINICRLHKWTSSTNIAECNLWPKSDATVKWLTWQISICKIYLTPKVAQFVTVMHLQIFSQCLKTCLFM